MPILTYESEGSALTKAKRNGMQAAEMKHLKKDKGVTRSDNVRTDDIRQELDAVSKSVNKNCEKQ